MHTDLRRKAFTLVELLVVITIIGILVGLLLPAVQQAREAGRQTTCRNNLRQIGIATTAYHEKNRKFPPGAVWVCNNTNLSRGSIFIRLLPHLEKKNLYEHFDLTQGTDNQTTKDTNVPLCSIVVPTFVCPTDNNQGTLNGRAVSNYCASNGPSAHINNPNCNCPNNFNEFALAPYERIDDFAGPFTRRCVTTTDAHCRDGLSNTIFFGEVRRDCSRHIQQGWSRSNNGNGLVSTQVPINYDSCQGEGVSPCHQPCNWSTELAFKSLHPVGAFFAFGDGSVHFLRQDIDHILYQYLGDKDDEKPARIPQ